jgi:hypothetical protein
LTMVSVLRKGVRIPSEQSPCRKLVRAGAR